MASVDEISMKFIDDKGKPIIITANIQVVCLILTILWLDFQENYPRQPPIWFSEDERPIVGSTLARLTEQEDNLTILIQVIVLPT